MENIRGSEEDGECVFQYSVLDSRHSAYHAWKFAIPHARLCAPGSDIHLALRVVPSVLADFVAPLMTSTFNAACVVMRHVTCDMTQHTYNLQD
jgi:hypothetical protein